MQIFALTVGYGRNVDMVWIAATSETEAAKLSGKSQKEIRKIRKFRDVNDQDQIVVPGEIVFMGFGVKGPAKNI